MKSQGSFASSSPSTGGSGAVRFGRSNSTVSDTDGAAAAAAKTRPRNSYADARMLLLVLAGLLGCVSWIQQHKVVHHDATMSVHTLPIDHDPNLDPFLIDGGGFPGGGGSRGTAKKIKLSPLNLQGNATGDSSVTTTNLKKDHLPCLIAYHIPKTGKVPRTRNIVSVPLLQHSSSSLVSFSLP